jgi:hypothetical protein
MTIRVTGDGEMFTGELQVEHSDGTTTVRQVASTHCDEVTDALEFVAALALGLDARPPAPPPAPEPEPEREPEPAPVPQRWRLFAAAYGGIASAAGPDVEFAPAVALGVMKDGLDLFAPELELSGTWSMSSHFATKLSPATSQTTLFDAALSVCPLQLGVGRSGAGPALRLRPCAGLQLGALTASTSLAGSTDQVEPWLAAAVLARAEWVFGKHFMLAADGGAAFPILRPDYFFRPSQVSDFHVPAAGGVARLGAAVLWP